MKNDLHTKSVLVQAGLKVFPKLIQESLLEDRSFLEEFGLSSDGVLSFGVFGLSVQQSELMAAIKKYHSGTPIVVVTDMKGRKWELKNIGKEGEQERMGLSQDDKQLVLTNFSPVSPEPNTRLASFDEMASNVFVAPKTIELWRNILSKRALGEDELDIFHTVFFNTPVTKAATLRREVSQGESDMASLVPNSISYFETLVGAYDGSQSIGEYANRVSSNFFQDLTQWQPYNGFLYYLLLSSHSDLTYSIDVGTLDNEMVIKAYKFIEREGDILSQLGAVEVGIRILPENPEVEPVLLGLINQIRDDDIEADKSNLELLSSLFILVDGELSRIRLFSKEPAFYRRLAAFAHAAMIHRQIINTRVDYKRLGKWAMDNRGQWFYLQTLTDLRSEPRWSPDLVSPLQLKQECFGRIMSAAWKNREHLKDGEIYRLALSSDPDSLKTSSKSLLPYLPGPLEGANDSKNELPLELLEAIDTQLKSEIVSPDSFITLVNSCLIYSLDQDQASLATEVLRSANHKLSDIEEKSQLVSVLNGLASVAAVTRASDLAEELQIIVRRYRDNSEYALSIEEDVRIGIAAAACHSDLDAWCSFVGEWVTELAFSELKPEEAKLLHAHLKRLCHMTPELWVTCGRADAALSSQIGHS